MVPKVVPEGIEGGWARARFGQEDGDNDSSREYKGPGCGPGPGGPGAPSPAARRSPSGATPLAGRPRGYPSDRYTTFYGSTAALGIYGGI